MVKQTSLRPCHRRDFLFSDTGKTGQEQTGKVHVLGVLYNKRLGRTTGLKVKVTLFLLVFTD